MNYKFPTIRTIDDVLPHIEGRDEFRVTEKDDYIVINYHVAFDDTFAMDGPDDLTGAIRRECRGLIFDTTGNLVSRPFHKFFNIGEREETQPAVIDLSNTHVVMEKMDGSMIRPVLIDGYMRLGTKMGVTDVSMQAETWLASQKLHKIEWLIDRAREGQTPLLEWVSPDNQIVLEYDEPRLVYLGSRDNPTGEYYMDSSCPFDVAPEYGSVDLPVDEYIAKERVREDREGDIIRFADGHMVKMKNDWYVRIHKIIDQVAGDRHIVKLILDEKLDDVVPLLPEKKANYVREFESHLHNCLDLAVAHYADYWDDIRSSGIDRKGFAVGEGRHNNVTDPFKNTYVFKMFDGANGRDVILDRIKKSVSTNTKWDSCAEWLGL